MADMRHISRAELLEQLNRRFSAAEIRRAASIINALPPDAQLGDICVALEIIPSPGLAEWRRVTGRVPIMIADAYVQGIRGYMAAIRRTRGPRYAGPKAITISIVDGERFGLSIRQENTGMRIELTWASQLPAEQPAPRRRGAAARARTGSAA